MKMLPTQRSVDPSYTHRSARKLLHASLEQRESIEVAQEDDTPQDRLAFECRGRTMNPLQFQRFRRKDDFSGDGEPHDYLGLQGG
jgi:hypothetical protein